MTPLRDGQPQHAPTAIEAAVAELRRMSVREVGADGVATELYAPGDAMADWHLSVDGPRFDEFVRLLDLQAARQLSVLDLGANPYILTYALARAGCAVWATGHPLPQTPSTVGPEYVEFQRVDSALSSRVPLRRFNVESDRFPFDDGSFDAVLCGELIEHLPNGPDHMLYECNRVLRSGGRLLLSTPNAVSLARIISLVRGVNPEWPFSPQGIYGRHNRTYTMTELCDLLIGNGFQIVLQKGLTYSHKREWYTPGAMGTAKWLAMLAPQLVLKTSPNRLQRWAEGLLLAATKIGGPTIYRPSWLYGAGDSVPMFLMPAPDSMQGHH